MGFPGVPSIRKAKLLNRANTLGPRLAIKWESSKEDVAGRKPTLTLCWKLFLWLAFIIIIILNGWSGGPCSPQSVQFSRSVVSDSLQPHESQHTRPPCPSPTPGVYSNACPLSWWCHPTISSSVIPFSSRLRSFPASGSFLVSQLFASGGQSIGVSASVSVLPMNIQDWFLLGWTGWIFLQSKGL